jgi:hypothetical protein
MPSTAATAEQRAIEIGPGVDSLCLRPSVQPEQVERSPRGVVHLTKCEKDSRHDLELDHPIEW